MDGSMRPIWVSVEDAIRISGIGRTLLYEMIADGRLKSAYAGRKRLVSVKSIEELDCQPTPRASRPIERVTRREHSPAA